MQRCCLFSFFLTRRRATEPNGDEGLTTHLHVLLQSDHKGIIEDECYEPRNMI